MNPNQAIIFDADVAAVEFEGGETFIFKGFEYILQRTPIVDNVTMVEDGYEKGFDFSIEVRVSQFKDGILPPSSLDTITIGDTDYCIVSTTPDQFGIVNHYAVKQKS